MSARGRIVGGVRPVQVESSVDALALEVVGWVLAVLLAAPAIVFGVLAWLEAKRARKASDVGVDLATESLQLSRAADERERDREERARREERVEFAHRLRELEQLTRAVGLQPTDAQLEEVFEMHIDMHSRALALRERSATGLVEYAAMVHSRRSDRLRSDRIPSPRDRPPGWLKTWARYGEIEQSWINDPEATWPMLQEQGLALILVASSVANEKQWHHRWPWK